MGNRHSASTESAGRSAESATGPEQAASGGSDRPPALSEQDFVALSSGVCRIRLAERKVGSGFLWRDGWLVTLASVLPSASDIERATFVFALPQRPANGGDEGKRWEMVLFVSLCATVRSWGLVLAWRF